jgi:predicted Zn-dependent peptidase
MVASWANVVTDKTGDALGAMLGDLTKFAAEGMTAAEVESTRSQARGELVSAYESVEGIAGRLVANAALGLGADHEAKAAKARDVAQKPELDALAKRFYDPAAGIIVVVGPRARVQPMIDKLGLPAPEMRDAEGAPLR